VAWYLVILLLYGAAVIGLICAFLLVGLRHWLRYPDPYESDEDNHGR
jgi:hypothetical protein